MLDLLAILEVPNPDDVPCHARKTGRLNKGLEDLVILRFPIPCRDPRFHVLSDREVHESLPLEAPELVHEATARSF